MLFADLIYAATHSGAGLSGAADIASVVVAAGVVIGGIIAVTKGMGHLKTITDVVKGRPASQGVDAIPSMVERFDAGEKRFNQIEAHLGTQDDGLANLEKIVTNGLSDGVRNAVALGEENKKLLEDHITAFKAAETQAAIVAAATAAAHLVVHEKPRNDT